MAEPRGIAIVGMGALFPEAPNLAKYWLNLRSGVDAIRDVPASRWDPVYYDPQSRAPDRIYCHRGGFVAEDTGFNALAYGVMPVAVQGAEPDQLITLEVAAKALADAGYSERPYARERTGVILGRGGYMTAGMARLNQFVSTAQQLVESLRTLVPGIGEEKLEAIKTDFQVRLGAGRPDTSIGLVPNLAASRIANRLDLHGPAYTVDAACASSLIAVDHGVRELTSGRCDVVLAGGVHFCQDVTFWSVFSRLGALSRSEQIRPFDRRADGLLIGEGVGLLVLKREADAERDGDRVYAVIRGTGVASDGRESSLMNPRVDGQLLALERAWRASGIDPKTIGLLEAHGTGTPAGDDAELTTLARFFGRAEESKPRAGLGSVKSMIGHTMPAAGAAGLIKAALAVYHGVMPPTLHCEEPHPLLEETRFRLITEAESWEQNGAPRRAGVNAFGFGGINAHVVIEAHSAERQRKHFSASVDRELSELLVLAEETPQELLAALDGNGADYGMGPCRLALVNPTAERRMKARQIIERGKPWHGRKEIWFTPHGLLDDGGKIAFLFPGVEATFDPRVEDVAARFDLPMPPDIGGTDLEQRGVGIVGVGRLLDEALRRIAVEPDMVAGHSIGEWSCMIAAGLVAPEAADAFLDSSVPGSLSVPDVAFAALGCGAKRAEEALAGLEDVAVSHDNCPHQSIICGRESNVDAVVVKLKLQGVLCQKLPFRSGFHSPLFDAFVEPHREHFAKIAIQSPKIPFWSATTCSPYPDDPDEIRALALQHLVKPVRFYPLIEALYEQGARVFVQVGTGSLVGFVDDVLRDRSHLAISANTPRRTGLEQLLRVGAALFVEGASVRLNELPATTTQEVRAPGTKIALSLGAPLVHLSKEHAIDMPRAAATHTASPSSDPVMQEFAAVFDQVVAAQKEVAEQYLRPRAVAPPTHTPTKSPTEKTWTQNFSVDEFPFLADHTFYRQPKNWPNMADRYPVVPMTMLIEMMIDWALQMVPGHVAIAVEDVFANRWMVVAPPIEVTVSATSDNVGRIEVRVGDYVGATVVVAETYPAPPAPSSSALKDERPAPIAVEDLYEKRWMFHGPAYQSVVAFGCVASDGIRGTLVAMPAKGALLDNAGQLMGYWIMINTDVDRLAFPVRIRSIRFFGPMPAEGDKIDCLVRIDGLDEKYARSHMELRNDGKVWTIIDAWDDRRFDSTKVLWPVLTHPEENSLAERRHGSYFRVVEHWRTAASRDLVARRYLSEPERAQMDALGPRRRRGWLLGRMAAKDAVREWLWQRGRGAMFPIEVTVHNEKNGRPVVAGDFSSEIRVSVAHKDAIAVAQVALGQQVGIDIERVEKREQSFVDIAYSDAELALYQGNDVDEWMTRLWTAKEAVGKASGLGLDGNPRGFEVREVVGERLLVASRKDVIEPLWVETRRDGEYIVAWTPGELDE